MTMSLKQAELEPQQMIARLDTFMAKIENLGNTLLQPGDRTRRARRQAVGVPDAGRT